MYKRQTFDCFRDKIDEGIAWFKAQQPEKITLTSYDLSLIHILRSLAGAVTGSLFETDAAEYFAQATGAFGSVPWHFIIVAVVSVILLTLSLIHI